MLSILKDIYPYLYLFTFIIGSLAYFKYVDYPNKSLATEIGNLKKELDLLKADLVKANTQIRDLDSSLDLTNQNRVQEALKLEEAHRLIAEVKQALTKVEDRVGDIRVDLAKIQHH